MHDDRELASTLTPGLSLAPPPSACLHGQAARVHVTQHAALQRQALVQLAAVACGVMGREGVGCGR